VKQERKRVRRSVEASRLAILEAAARHLIADGPEGVKVQRVARELGLTDAAIHYHFGSREALMEALLRYSGRQFVAQLREAVANPAATAPALRDVATLLLRFYQDRGAARLAMWLALSGWQPEGSGMLEPLVDRLHAQRLANAKKRGDPRPIRRDSQSAIAVLSAAAFSQALVGDAIWRSVGADETRREQLVTWLAELLESRELGGSRRA
jgi:AcrR family transcriptional regulator